MSDRPPPRRCGRGFRPSSAVPVLPLAAALVAVSAAVAGLPAPAPAQQAVDEEYTRLIREHLTDERISTELVDYLPASDVVPTTLEFPGIERVVGTPGELTHAADIHRYMKAIADAGTGRARYFVMGRSEEGRDIIALAVADEETIAELETYKGYLHALTDPRVTSEEEARRLIGIARPIYWITSGLHSTERGGPEMLMELAYRLVVDESQFVRDIRENVITFITPVLEVDGRERMVDTYLFNQELRERASEEEEEEPGGGGRGGGGASLPLMYWGKYVQHDNNRDGMGQFLALTRHSRDFGLEWRPTIMHDLHEAQTLLYSSTGTGPYNEGIDAITVNEWWMFAEHDVMEMTKRGVPGVWTYGFYDGWTPNYLFYVAHAHNAVGRFYEVASYGPNNRTVNANQSREWYRPNPLQGSVEWGPRANTNIQQSALLFSLHFTGDQKERWLENYWIKNKRAVERGTNGPVYGWVVPASQHGKADAAEAVNELIDQGLEFHVADRDFEVGELEVREGDWIVRGDQPFRTIADIYFSVQAFPTSNPSPYDDTGWTYPYMRDLVIEEARDEELLSRPMSPVTGHVRAAGGIDGNGPTVVVAHRGDNALVSFRFRFADVRMEAAERAFDVDGRSFPAGSFIIPAADHARLEPALQELGLSGTAVEALPADLPTHDLDVPRIGYIHSWRRTQDEGWVRAAFDTYGVPYTYFGENEVHARDLRAEFDVIVYPHGGSVGSLPDGGMPIPYRRSETYPALGYPDSTADVRGQLGEEGLGALYEFVRAGGTLIAEGNTAAIFPQYELTPGVRIAETDGLIARGSIYRALLVDDGSPIGYGIGRNQMPVYFSQSPVLDAGVAPADPADPELVAEVVGRGGRGGRGRGGGVYQNISPMATRVVLSDYDPRSEGPEEGSAEAAVEAAREQQGGGGRGAGGGFGRGRGGGGGGGGGSRLLDFMQPRIILQFPPYAEDMLLSGMLEGGENLSNRAQVVDSPVGDGHMVLFAIRPFWRWQTQGTYILGFNAILNWNDLDAGRE